MSNLHPKLKFWSDLISEYDLFKIVAVLAALCFAVWLMWLPVAPKLWAKITHL